VCCSAVAAVVGSSTRATNSRNRRGSHSIMWRDLYSELCDAAKSGDVGEIERLIAAGAKPNALEGADSITPLQLAAAYGHVAAIAALLKAGAHVDGARSDGITPLTYAAMYDRTDAIDALIAAGVDVRRTLTDGNTVLHWASQFGRLVAARALLEAGAETSALDSDGKRPIDVVRDRRDRDRLCDVVCGQCRSHHRVLRGGAVRRLVAPTMWPRPTKPPCARCC